MAIINPDDPEYIVLPALRRGELPIYDQENSNIPIIAGSYRGQQQGALVAYATLILYEKHPEWLDIPINFCDEDETGFIQVNPQKIDDALERAKSFDLSDLNKQLIDRWIEDLENQLSSLYANYNKKIEMYKSEFSSSVADLGYSENQVNSFFDEYVGILERESPSPTTCFLRYEPLTPTPSAPPLVDAQSLEAENAADYPPADAQRIIPPMAEARVIRHVADTYVLQPDQTGLERMLNIKKLSADYLNGPPSLEFLKATKKAAEKDILPAIKELRVGVDDAMLHANVPPAARDIQDYCFNPREAQAKSTAPVPRPGVHNSK